MMRNSRLNTIDYSRWQKRPLFRPRRRSGWRTLWVILALVAVVSAVAATLHENPLVGTSAPTDVEVDSGDAR